MLSNNDSNRKKLITILDRRSQEVLQAFRRATIAGINDADVVSILEGINVYWKDIYRPALTSFSCEAVGGEISIAEDASLMITLSAAGMGIHDDIIDRSDVSHFRRTILGRFGLDKSLLVGDLLIIKGLTTALTFLQKSVPPEKRKAIIGALQNFFVEIYEGALMDISCRRNLSTDVDLFSEIIWKLTADGEVCSRIGAILGGGSENEIQALAEFGRRLGFVHHLGEEVNDSMNEEGALPHRIEFESVPLPILYASKASRNAFMRIESILGQPSLATNDVTDLIKLCWKSRAFAYAYQLAKKNADQGLDKLTVIRPGPARDALSLMMQVSLKVLRRARDLESRYSNC